MTTFRGKAISGTAYLKQEKSEGEARSSGLFSVTGGTAQDIDKSLRLIAVISGVIRISSLFLVRTYFVPDEYWQSVEVAHHQAFGYGYLTWEWKECVRSYMYPAVFTLMYNMLRVLQLDYLGLLIALPRLFHCGLMVFNDIYSFKLASALYGKQAAMYTVALQFSSWFLYYTGSRTLSNSIEMVFITVGLYFYFAGYKKASASPEITITIFIAWISFAIRPTVFVMWLPIMVHTLFGYRKNLKLLCVTAVVALLLGLVVFLINAAIDYSFYGKIVVPAVNFVSFNVIHNLSGFYGSHPWHWYVFQGLPAVLGPQFILFLLGMWKGGVTFVKTLICIFVIALSIIDHKEFRFILPILPLCFGIAGRGLASFKLQNDKGYYFWRWKIFGALCLVINACLALYTGLVHQKAPLDTIHYLSEEASGNANSSFLFLLPCHSTPFYSHIHRNVRMRFLTCHPSSDPGYVEEGHLFFAHPEAWLEHEYRKHFNKLPSALVFFDVLRADIALFLSKHGFRECARFFHTHFPSGHVGRYMIIYCR